MPDEYEKKQFVVKGSVSDGNLGTSNIVREVLAYGILKRMQDVSLSPKAYVVSTEEGYKLATTLNPNYLDLWQYLAPGGRALSQAPRWDKLDSTNMTLEFRGEDVPIDREALAELWGFNNFSRNWDAVGKRDKPGNMGFVNVNGTLIAQQIDPEAADFSPTPDGLHFRSLDDMYVTEEFANKTDLEGRDLWQGTFEKLYEGLTKEDKTLAMQKLCTYLSPEFFRALADTIPDKVWESQPISKKAFIDEMTGRFDAFKNEFKQDIAHLPPLPDKPIVFQKNVWKEGLEGLQERNTTRIVKGVTDDITVAWKHSKSKKLSQAQENNNQFESELKTATLTKTAFDEQRKAEEKKVEAKSSYADRLKQEPEKKSDKQKQAALKEEKAPHPSKHKKKEISPTEKHKKKEKGEKHKGGGCSIM